MLYEVVTSAPRRSAAPGSSEYSETIASKSAPASTLSRASSARRQASSRDRAIVSAAFFAPLYFTSTCRTPTLLEVTWLAGVAVFATSGHYAITHAIAAAPLTVTQPLRNNFV